MGGNKENCICSYATVRCESICQQHCACAKSKRGSLKMNLWAGKWSNTFYSKKLKKKASKSIKVICISKFNSLTPRHSNKQTIISFVWNKIMAQSYPSCSSLFRFWLLVGYSSNPTASWPAIRACRKILDAFSLSNWLPTGGFFVWRKLRTTS